MATEMIFEMTETIPPWSLKDRENLKIELWRDFLSLCALRLTDRKGKLQPPLVSHCLVAGYSNKEIFSAL